MHACQAHTLYIHEAALLYIKQNIVWHCSAGMTTDPQRKRFCLEGTVARLSEISNMHLPINCTCTHIQVTNAMGTDVSPYLSQSLVFALLRTGQVFFSHLWHGQPDVSLLFFPKKTAEAWTLVTTVHIFTAFLPI